MKKIKLVAGWHMVSLSSSCQLYQGYREPDGWGHQRLNRRRKEEWERCHGDESIIDFNNITGGGLDGPSSSLSAPSAKCQGTDYDRRIEDVGTGGKVGGRRRAAQRRQSKRTGAGDWG